MMGSHGRALGQRDAGSFTYRKCTALWDGGNRGRPCGGDGGGICVCLKRAATEKETDRRGCSRATRRQTHPKDAWQVPGLGVNNIRGQDGGG